MDLAARLTYQGHRTGIALGGSGPLGEGGRIGFEACASASVDGPTSAQPARAMLAALPTNTKSPPRSPRRDFNAVFAMRLTFAHITPHVA